MRWLIMFVGISERNGTPVRYKVSRPTHVVIEQFDGGVAILLNTGEAQALAQVWLGCSQATSPPTQGTNHPDIGEKALANAFQIIVSHLQKTIYDHARMDLAKVTLG